MSPFDEGEPRHQPVRLTKNEQLVWSMLSASRHPLKAYEILDLLKEQGVRAPMTVYRALDGLEHKGYIHKLEGLNAFVPCNHDGPHAVQAFLVCDQCPVVQEIDIVDIAKNMEPVIEQAGFEMHLARLEVRGKCRDCAQKVADGNRIIDS